MKTRNDLNNMSMVEVVNYYNSLVDNYKTKTEFKTAGPKTFNSKSKAIERVMTIQAEIESVNIPVELEKPVQVKERGHKMATIRQILMDNDEVDRADLAHRIGSDEKNTHIMVTILCNAKRTKDWLVVTYDRKNKVYRRITGK